MARSRLRVMVSARPRSFTSRERQCRSSRLSGTRNQRRCRADGSRSVWPDARRGLREGLAEHARQLADHREATAAYGFRPPTTSVPNTAEPAPHAMRVAFAESPQQMAVLGRASGAAGSRRTHQRRARSGCAATLGVITVTLSEVEGSRPSATKSFAPAHASASEQAANRTPPPRPRRRGCHPESL